jgi:hypothetical protein
MGSSAQDQMVRTTYGPDLLSIYETGFAEGVMKNGSGVSLFDMELIENDGPGSGYSEKGVCIDHVYGQSRARKILYLSDPRSLKSWLVIYTSQFGRFPLSFSINGHPSRLSLWDTTKNSESYRWVEFPAAWLKSGENTIELSCPEAGTEEEGWAICLSRADEFAEGGGDPKPVGKTSLKSFDGGKSWKQSPFGPGQNERAEYTIRLSLDRYLRSGWLATPVVDLWKGSGNEAIVPQRELRKLKISLRSEVPPGTSVTLWMRTSTAPSPFSNEWSPYFRVGQGAGIETALEGGKINRRYVQLKAVLETQNPEVSPALRSLQLEAELVQRVKNPIVFVAEIDNPTLRYSSLPWEWEKSDRPELQIVRERENLDELLAGRRTQFEALVRLLDYANKRWRGGSSRIEYPRWDALSILARIDKAGQGGMCLHYNNVLGGLGLAFGWQFRHLNIAGHEIVEVWSDDFGKWVFLDAYEPQNSYFCDPDTGEPLSTLELHQRYLKLFYPDRPIDWLNDSLSKSVPADTALPVLRGSPDAGRRAAPMGLLQASFMRLIPRNNWYEKPFPRPANHGESQWPWTGYVNWYDERTPRFRQYPWHTDRVADFWPDLNRVHITPTKAADQNRLYLYFETYTPNFSHFEVNVDDTGWKKTAERWTWYLHSGRNTLLARAVSQAHIAGKASRLVINYVDRLED